MVIYNKLKSHIIQVFSVCSLALPAVAVATLTLSLSL